MKGTKHIAVTKSIICRNQEQPKPELSPSSSNSSSDTSSTAITISSCDPESHSSTCSIAISISITSSNEDDKKIKEVNDKALDKNFQGKIKEDKNKLSYSIHKLDSRNIKGN